MPTSPILEDEALRCIRAHVSRQTGVPPECMSGAWVQEFLNSGSSAFDWDLVGEDLGVSKRQIKRWYFETYQRHTHQKVTRQDAKLLQKMICEALDRGEDVNSKAAQMGFEARLSQPYHKQAFYTAYTNAKRLVIERQDCRNSLTASEPSATREAELCGGDIVAQVLALVQKL